MYTSAECQARAEEKLAQPASDVRHRQRLNAAAQAWILLARRMNEVEVACMGGE